jgi:signal transduction histidine kinase
MVSGPSAQTRIHHAVPVRDRGRRILLVEDDDDIAEALRATLEEAGYSVETCHDGQQALDSLRESPADLVVLDLVMPVMDGWQFRALQRSDRSIADIPVVVITADSSAKAAAVHAESYVKKPFGANELMNAVERVFLEKDRKACSSHLEETERLAQLGVIAAGVGHEINNPLSFTMGNLELSDAVVAALKSDVTSLPSLFGAADYARAVATIDERLDKLATLVQDARTGAERVRLIVRNLQSLGRRSEDMRSRLDLREVVDSSISIVWSHIKSRATLKRVYKEVLDVAGDETRLGQVFLNLLMNAAQAIDGAAPETNAIVVTIRRESDVAVVEIEDNGVGMSKAQEARAFEPFFTTKGHGEGTGLGLSISREIVNAHGGEITVRSEPGRGSTFTVRLPVWIATDHDATMSLT